MKSIKSILIYCLGSFLIVVLFELLLRYGGILTPTVTIDPQKGECYIPNKTVSSIFLTEGFGLDRINSAGWFGPEYPSEVDKSKETSIAVIGNSFVVARQVFQRDNFLSLAEKKLEDKSSKKIKFYNFGKEDLPLRQLFYIKEEVEAVYKPDYLLILINDESFNTHDADRRYTPYYNLVNDTLQIDTSFKSAPFVKLFNKVKPITSLSVTFLANRVKNHLPNTAGILLDKFYWEEEPLEAVIDNNLIIKERDKKVIQELDKNKKVIFLVDLEAERKKQLDSLVKNAPVIELHEALAQLKKEGVNPYGWELENLTQGHWNIEGHKVVSKELAAGIIKIINKNQN